MHGDDFLAQLIALHARDGHVHFEMGVLMLIGCVGAADGLLALLDKAEVEALQREHRVFPAQNGCVELLLRSEEIAEIFFHKYSFMGIGENCTGASVFC